MKRALPPSPRNGRPWRSSSSTTAGRSAAGQPRRRRGAQLVPALPRRQAARGDHRECPRRRPELGVGADKTIGGVIAEFESACAASRQIAAGFALDQTVPHDQAGQVSLHWIYVNVIAEHARHAGHADIIREQIDGATGD